MSMWEWAKQMNNFLSDETRGWIPELVMQNFIPTVVLL